MATNFVDHSIQNFDTKTDINNLAVHWQKWLRSFNYYLVAKDITKEPQKKALLLHLAGSEVQDIYETLVPLENEGDKTEVDIAINRLTNYFTPKHNKNFERHVFRGLNQNSSETMDQYVTRLRQQSKRCDFGDRESESIVGQIVDGCSNKKLRIKVLERGDEVSLDEVIRMAKAMEISAVQAKSFEPDSNTINKISSNGNNNKGKFKPKFNNTKTAQSAQNYNKQMTPSKLKCFRCDRPDHLARDNSCPAKKVKCNICHKIGHYAICCKTKSKSTVHCVAKAENNYAFSVGKGDNVVTCTVGGVKLDCLVDSGASVNIIDTPTWQHLKSQNIECKSWQVKEKVFSYGKPEGLNVIGRFSTNVEHSNKVVNTEFLVFEGTGKPILSSNTCEVLELISLNINQISDVQESHAGLFSGVGKLKDYKLKLHIDKTKPPIAQKLRPVPFQMRDKIQKALNELISLDIIEEVDGPTQWVSPIVVVPKKTGEVRICVDMRQANEAITRVRHPLPTIEDLLQVISEGEVFSKLDLKWGFHQIELDEESREITTFITHCGLYRYKRLMFGVSSAPEMYQHITGQLVADIPGVVNFIDDLVVFGKTKAEHDERLEMLLKRLEEKGLTLNKGKCEMGKEEMELLGFHIGKKGISPTEQKVKAISEARQPENPSELRSFLGLVNFCGKFIPNLATLTEPLRKLTRKDNSFFWTNEQENAFIQIKAAMSEPKHLTPFKKNAKTILVTDAGPVGLGAILIQVQDGQEKIISYASKGLTDVEKRYSQTEKEALGIVWGCEHFYPYLYGQHFELRTDHKPLIFIYSSRSKPSARIERWVLRLQPYQFTIKHIAGDLNIADSLSRLSITDSSGILHKAEEYIYHVAQYSTPAAISTKELERASDTDPELQFVRSAILSGNWEGKDIPTAYKAVKSELTVLGKLVLRGTRLVIPKSYQAKILQLGHLGHQGIVKTKRKLRTKVWWPGIDKGAEKVCKTCRECLLVGANPSPEPVIRNKIPEGPWRSLAADFLGPLPNGKYILVVVDYYSRWFEVAIMSTITSKTLIRALDHMWATHGLPEEIRTDNGPQFASNEFSEYMAHNGMMHIKTTPLWPQANGEVEIQNKTLLKHLKISVLQGQSWAENLDKFLLEYRVTPHTVTGVAPAELLFGRLLKTKLPSLHDRRDPVMDEGIRDHDSIQKLKGKIYADKARNAKPSEVEIGDTVVIQNEKKGKLDSNFQNKDCVVTAKAGNKLTVETPEGRVYSRNTTMVKKIPFVEQENNTNESNEHHIEENYDEQIYDQDTSESEAQTMPSMRGDLIRGKRETKFPTKFKDYVLN